MGFWDSEKSLTEGEPYELHEFRLGQTDTYWRYADAPEDVTSDGNVFTAVYITGGEIEAGSNTAKSRTTVRTDWTNPFAWQYTTTILAYPVGYKRYKGHGGDVLLEFVGEVSSVIFKQQSRQGDRWAEINVDPPKASLENAIGHVSRYSRQCTAPLYSNRCGVDRDSFKQTGVLDAVNGNILNDTVFGGESDGYWVGGDIIINGLFHAKIIDHSGNNVTILPFIYGIAAGDSFDIAPGCNHLIAPCHSKFNNRVNMKAQPNIPNGTLWSADALY